MMAALSRRSEMLRTDAAYGLAISLREICEKAITFTFSDNLVEVSSRRGFALRDALGASQPHSATYHGRALVVVHVDMNHSTVVVESEFECLPYRFRSQASLSTTTCSRTPSSKRTLRELLQAGAP